MKVAQTLADMSEIKDAAKEPAIKMTQNSYGYYASVIGTIGKAIGAPEPKAGHFLAAEALILAGANKNGVYSAMQAFYGYSEYDPLNAMLNA